MLDSDSGRTSASFADTMVECESRAIMTFFILGGVRFPSAAPLTTEATIWE